MSEDDPLFKKGESRLRCAKRWCWRAEQAETRVKDLKLELKEWQCDTVPGRCRGCPDCQPIGGTRTATLDRNAFDDRSGDGGS